jgi:Flp pilus assembly protein TadB
MIGSENDHEQDKLLTEHSVRINMLEGNVSTLFQATTSLTQSVTAQTEQIRHLMSATTTTLKTIERHAEVMAGLNEAGTWLKRIAWGALGCVVVVLGYYVQKSIGG